MDPTFGGESIADMTRSCLEAARQSIQHLRGEDKDQMQMRVADLRLWADSVGATARAKASLDSRFQHRPSDIYVIKGLLFMLRTLFSDFAIAAGTNSDVSDLLANISSTVDSMAIVGVQIRRSGRQSRLRKADGSFDRNRDKYRNLRAHLACVITSRPTEDGRPADETEGLHGVDYFANLKLTSIQERLIEVNLRRRHRFLEAQRHSHGLKDSLAKADQLVLPLLTATNTPTIHSEQKVDTTPAEVVVATTQETQTLPTSHRYNAPVATVTSASGLDSKWGGLQDRRQPGSTVTRITSITATARYPKAHAPSYQKLVKCPCCCQAIPASEVEEDSQWRKHLANDINPYTCIFDNCPTPYKLFATHSEWQDHFMDDHPSQWQCRYCKGGLAVFGSLSGVITHIVSSHPDVVSNNLQDLLAGSEVKMMGITKCPLCDSEGPPDSPDLVEHVLQHIHDFSLRSLPWPSDPTFLPSTPAATFDPDCAVKLFRDDEGNEYPFSIAEWAESIAPNKPDLGKTSVFDSEGQEQFLGSRSMTSDGRLLLQLCDLDKNPPKISEIESTSTAQVHLDYFSGNPYFIDESSVAWSSDSSSQNRDPSNQGQDIRVWKEWTCTLCRAQSGEGDDEYYRHIESTHYEDMEAATKDRRIDIEEWKLSMLYEAYGNGMDTIPVADSAPISHSGPIPEEELNQKTVELRRELEELLEEYLGRVDVNERARFSLSTWGPFWKINQLADYFDKKGKSDEGEDLLRKGLERSEKMLGPEHRDTLRSMERLASFLLRRRKYREAEYLYRKAVKGWERLPGPVDFHDIPFGVLAMVLERHEKFEEAENFRRKAVEKAEKQLGPAGSDTLRNMQDLASLLERRQKYEEAENLYRKTVERLEKLPDIANSVYFESIRGVVRVLKKQENYEEAENFWRKRLEKTERLLGPEHRDTFRSMQELAILLEDWQKYEEAENLYRKIVERWENSQGRRYFNDIRNFLEGLARVLKRQKKYEAAESQYRKTIEHGENFPGEKYIYNICNSIGVLAGFLESQEKYEEAEKLHRKALEKAEEPRSPKYSNILVDIKRSLANNLRKQGKTEEAEAILDTLYSSSDDGSDSSSESSV